MTKNLTLVVAIGAALGLTLVSVEDAQAFGRRSGGWGSCGSNGGSGGSFGGWFSRRGNGCNSGCYNDCSTQSYSSCGSSGGSYAPTSYGDSYQSDGMTQPPAAPQAPPEAPQAPGGGARNDATPNVNQEPVAATPRRPTLARSVGYNRVGRYFFR